MKLLKPKKCKATGCGETFTPRASTQIACTWQCAVAINEAKKAKERRKETKEKLEKLKTRSDWLREAQIAFNRYIRARDYGKPCISCGRHHQGKWNAGHYRSVGAAPELRFTELNVHLQCEPCNSHLSGNIVEYRKRLVEKIGIEKVEWLEGNHEPLRLSIDDIRTIKIKYGVMARQLEKERGAA